MLRRFALAVGGCFLGTVALAQDPAQVETPSAGASVAEAGLDPRCPEVHFDVPPSLSTVAPRMPLEPTLPPPVDPRTIYFDPYFFPTHYNFRPFPYGYPPTDMGFFYGAFANPYYGQYYGPGEYYGF